MNKTMLLASLALAGVTLSAQDKWIFDAKVGLVSAQGDLGALTEKKQGHAFEVGASYMLNSDGFGVRPHGGHMVVRRKVFSVPATDRLSDTADAKNSWFGMDFLYESKSLPVVYYTGPMACSWDITAQIKGAMDDTSYKFGWRVGLTVKVTKAWAVDAYYGLSEWTRYTPRIPEAGNSASTRVVNRNPSWFAVSGVYRF